MVWHDAYETAHAVTNSQIGTASIADAAPRTIECGRTVGEGLNIGLRASTLVNETTLLRRMCWTANAMPALCPHARIRAAAESGPADSEAIDTAKEIDRTSDCARVRAMAPRVGRNPNGAARGHTAAAALSPTERGHVQPTEVLRAMDRETQLVWCFSVPVVRVARHAGDHSSSAT